QAHRQRLFRPRQEMTPLVKFPVGRNGGFGHQAQDFPPAQGRRHVVQLSAVFKGQTDEDQSVHILCFLRQQQQLFPGTSQKGILAEQITAGVAGDTKFRQRHHFGFLFFHPVDTLHHLFPVENAVRYLYIRRRRRHFYKSLSHSPSSYLERSRSSFNSATENL